MWWLAVRAIVSSIIGSSFYQWFKNTKVGVWFQDKLDDFLEYLADKYNIEIAKREDKWLSQYPRLAERILDLEKDSHPPIGLCEFDGFKELQNDIELLKKRIEEIEKNGR